MLADSPVLKPANAAQCLSALVVMLPLASAVGQEKQAPTYRSPYTVKFTVPLKELAGDLRNGERGDFHRMATVPFTDWYGQRVRTEYGPWGPPARHFPAPEGLAKRSLDWQRQRVLAAGLRFVGYGYQHHHLPDWDPPPDWPWKETKGGSNGKGVDCSNFTGLAYNLALGLKPSTAIKKQAEQLKVPWPGKSTIQAIRIEKPASYGELVRTLKTADLLFIRNRKGDLAHVVLWVGSVGQGPDETPLVLDSHGEGVRDAQGKPIPHGVYLRPFRENSWYFHSASHAHRLLHP